MSDLPEYPRLRWPIDIRVEHFEGQDILVLNCPVGVSKQPLLLVSAIAPVISCFEGNLSLHEILARFAQHGLTEEMLRGLVTLLDDNLFLASPKFFAAQKQMLDDFAAADVRPSSLAGLGYSNNPAELTKQLDEYLQNGHTNGVAHKGALSCLVAPHIDYRRGSVCYGITYNQLRSQKHDLYILIGTSHQYSRHMFHLSRKHFETPLGMLPCEREFTEKLSELYGAERSFADEILHKREHSLELQLPFMKHLAAESSIVPILVGSFYEMLGPGNVPATNETYDRFVTSLVECIKSYIGDGKSFSFVAGVDMAHVGRFFGDKEALNHTKMDEIAERDRIYLDALMAQDKKKLFEHIAEDGDARRICGFPTMYTIIDTFDRLGIKYRSELFDYRQAVDYKTDCAVTFAGMGFYV